MWTVPFLPPLLFKGFASGLGMLANHYAGSLQGNASSAAAQVAAGDFNMGTTSFGNQSWNNIGANKWDTNVLNASGNTTVQNAFGGTDTLTRSGNVVTNAAGALSTYPFSVDMQSAMSSSLSKGMSTTTQAIQDASSSLQKSSSMAASDMVQLGQMAGSNSTTGAGSSISQTAELGQNYNQALDIAEQYRKDHHLSSSAQETLQSLVGGSISAGAGLPGGGVSPVSASADLSASGQSISDKIINSTSNAYHDLSSNQRQGIDSFINAAKQYTATTHTELSNTTGTNLSKDIQDNLSNVTQQSDTLSSSLQKMSSYHQEAQTVNSSQFMSNEGGIYNTMFADYLNEHDPSLSYVLLNNPNLSANQKEVLDTYLQGFANQVVSTGSFASTNNSISAGASSINADYKAGVSGVNAAGGGIAEGFSAGSNKLTNDYQGANIASGSSVSSQVADELGGAKDQISSQGSQLGSAASNLSNDVSNRFGVGDKVANEGALVGAAKSIDADLLEVGKPLSGAAFAKGFGPSPGVNSLGEAVAGKTYDKEENKMKDSELNFTNPNETLNGKTGGQ